MNRDEILKMPAGREVDALIADNIMKLEKTQMAEWRWSDGEMIELPWYSSDIEDAWLLVEKLRSLVWDFYIGFDSDENKINVMWRENGGTVVEKMIAETAPLAICRAALMISL